MHFSLEDRSISLSVGEFADFSLGPRDSGGGPQGLWRAQLGQHWHNELRARTEKEFAVGGAIRPDVQFEVPINGRLIHRGWTFVLQGRIDQQIGPLLREIKSVTRPLPADETALRTDYPGYFLQLAAYVLLVKNAPPNAQLITNNRSALRAELIFVEAGSGLAQTIALTPFDEALVFHQLDALVEFLNQQLRATARRRSLQFHSPFAELRPGQESIQADLATAFDRSENSNLKSQIVLFEAPTGYGKTGCVLEFALGQLKAGRFDRLIWLTGKSTGQIQVMRTLRQMSERSVSLPGGPSSREAAADAPPPASRELGPPPQIGHPAAPAGTSLAVWQIRNKAEHCVNHTFHCVRDGCDYLRDCAERWPGSGLSRFYLNENEPRDLDTVRAAGRAALICPYEITRAALAFNDVWIGDFNYVFAPDNRGLFFDQPGFDPAKTLLVVDEAHNLPSRVAGAYSHSASESDARLLLAELDHLQAPAVLVLAVEEWIRLLASLEPTESLDPVTEAELRDLLDRLVKLATTMQLDYVALGPKHSETLWQFVALADFLADQNLTKLIWVARPGQLEFTCVDAATAIGEALRAFGGSILMSATLQPYAEFAASCGLVGRGLGSAPGDGGQGTAHPTYQTLTAPTPWRAGAYDVAVDLRVDTTFRNRSTHYGTTAATIVALSEAASRPNPGVRNSELGVRGSDPLPPNQEPLTPNPATSCVAVFFPSYAYAEAIEKTLSDYGSVLRVALQPKLPDLAAQTAWVEENLVFSDALFLVLGSSFAEGIDLLGGRVTHAMVVGPALPEVNAVQKARLAAFSDLGRDAAFRRVYQIPGLQKVNQGLGRLVRAPGQKAKVLLHCRRFAEPSYASLLATDYQMFSEVTTDSDLQAWLTGHCDE
ncbi:MAG TPA: helicase C-terminal domain-containing protein [Lacunisphaera sp.]